uniref:Receptor ligand binding region domain-containing protein n=1 Tax=Panagrolaimus sp. PS1159 TaxID=55785 RepID=A0AC35EYL9_9BILA
PPLSIKAGLLIPSNTSFLMPFENTAGAFTVALDRIRNENLLPAGTNFTLYWRYEECMESTSMGYSLELVHDIGVDVLFAPPCIDGSLIAGHVGTYYNIPVMLWGMTFDSEFANVNTFPTTMSVISNYKDMGNVICDLLKYYDWTSFALIYQADEDGSCFSFQEDIEAISQQRENCLIGYQEPVDSWADVDIKFTINQIKNNARIIVLCFDDNIQQRQFAITLAENGMNTNEYLYIIPDADMKIAVGLEETPWWIDTTGATTSKDAAAKTIGLHSLVLSNIQVAADTGKNYETQFVNFSKQVMAKMSDWPFYCPTCNRGQNASAYASTLYDVVYLYGLVLSNTIKQYGLNSTIYRNGRLITKNSDLEFEGMSGPVRLGPDGVRDSTYAIFGYDDAGKRVQYLSFATSDTGIVRDLILIRDKADPVRKF